jgi:hypothetical protein
MMMKADLVAETLYSSSESRTIDYVQKLIKFPQGISRVNWLKIAEVAGIIFVPIVRVSREF